MMSVLGAAGGELSEREIDMMDWGFAFGVAWAVARDQDPGAPEELVSVRALEATQAVYEAYRGSPAPAQALDLTPSAPHAHAHGARSAPRRGPAHAAPAGAPGAGRRTSSASGARPSGGCASRRSRSRTRKLPSRAWRRRAPAPIRRAGAA